VNAAGRIAACFGEERFSINPPQSLTEQTGGC